MSKKQKKIRPTPTPEGNEPDGFIVVHHPTDGSEPYGVGPFPWIEPLAELLLTHKRCDCRVETLSVAFPLGITMVVSGVDFGEMADVLNALKAIRESDEQESARAARPN
jgi:hypothetical protein